MRIKSYLLAISGITALSASLALWAAPSANDAAQLQQQLQQAHMKIAHWQSAHALAERSLQMLQQSRAVRGARALRRLLGLAR